MVAARVHRIPSTRGGKEHHTSRGAGRRLSWHSVREQFTWWEITIFVIGVISLLTVLSALFFAVGDRPTTITTDGPVPAVASPEFATALSSLVDAPIDHGGTVAILNNGDEFLPSLLESIRSAARSINFSVYIWKDGEFADQVLPALLAAQRRGVKVRLLL